MTLDTVLPVMSRMGPVRPMRGGYFFAISKCNLCKNR